jgi:hypothetical protein
LPGVNFSLIWRESGKTLCRFGQLILELPDLPGVEARPQQA